MPVPAQLGRALGTGVAARSAGRPLARDLHLGRFAGKHPVTDQLIGVDAACRIARIDHEDIHTAHAALAEQAGPADTVVIALRKQVVEPAIAREILRDDETPLARASAGGDAALVEIVHVIEHHARDGRACLRKGDRGQAEPEGKRQEGSKHGSDLRDGFCSLDPRTGDRQGGGRSTRRASRAAGIASCYHRRAQPARPAR